MFVPPFVALPASAFGALLTADFLTGLLHWSEDTWTAPGRNALLDRWIVRDNIEHHRVPGSIRGGDYWINNRVCIALAATAAVICIAAGVHAWPVYLTLVLVSQANHVHMWAHCANPPRPVAWLQRLGLLQATRHHAVHHARPYATRYCTYTNYLNPILDRIGFWRMLESIVVRLGATVYRATPARNGY